MVNGVDAVGTEEVTHVVAYDITVSDEAVETKAGLEALPQRSVDVQARVVALKGLGSDDTFGIEVANGGVVLDVLGTTAYTDVMAVG